MNKLKKIIYDCHRATFLIEKQQVGGLTFRERLEWLIHLAGCSVCRLFRRQSLLINRLLRQIFHADGPTAPKLDEYYKQQLQERIEERLKK